MSFFGKSFIYNLIPSDTFGLFISELDSGAINRQMGSMPVEIYEQKIFRKPSPYFFGSSPSAKLKFDFSAHAERDIDADEFQIIQKWLFGSKTYKKFQIVQEDIESCYWLAILNNPQITRVGNLIHGFSATIECNSPYAFKFPKTTTYNYTSPDVDSVEVFYNSSDDADSYLYPSLVLTINTFGGDVSIVNESDNDREFLFTGLSAHEVITMDNGLQTISSSTGLKRLGNFNKKFLRLVPGVNNLHITGNIETVAMTTQFIAKKI